jgi:hypothetical protein
MPSGTSPTHAGPEGRRWAARRAPSPPADLLAGRSILVAHSRRHHLHQTARAYHEAGRLGAFLTQVYVHRPGRLNVLKLLFNRRVMRRIGKLAAYNEPVISDRV